ncbi:MAG TPA: DHH family phosphoesterase [Polyangia bacterium]|jgi:nanoRNase/pAp phosphatase (c-di-AMP/oligoRNAs hydrolase)|nr:DHH family phosphoesterase [Polyangia bacterium]
MDEPPPAPVFDLERAIAGLAGRKSVLIYTHDNPDPDSLAAAMSLGRLLEHELGARVTLTHGGIVGRAQNRAMVEALRLDLVPTERVEPDHFDIIALVDSQPETGNNSLPPGHRIDIVVDHHPPRAGSARAPWCDIRPDRGATSSIIFEYLSERHIALDAVIASGMFFALRTETRDLGRESTEAERRAYLQLVPLVDHAMLYRMTHPKVPREHFAALDRALRYAQVFGDIVAVNLSTLGYPDLVAEIADLLLSYEGARYVLCMGEYDGSAYLSLRTEATDARAGSIMRQVVGADGAAGGHGTMAGARLFAVVPSDLELQKTFLELVDRLRHVLGHDAVAPMPLLPPKSPRNDKTLSGRPRPPHER